MTSKPGLLAFSLTLTAIGYALMASYGKDVRHLMKAVTAHEDLLCILWQGKALNIRFPNGDHYWVDRKDVDDQSVRYEDMRI